MIWDVLGIGFGPSNIALAIALEEAGYQGTVLFTERNAQSQWHQGMLLDGADIQNHPLRDLITPVNPRSRYTFVNYLHETGRFWRYLNLGQHYPLRKEFFEYVRWVSAQLRNVRYGVDIREIEPIQTGPERLWQARDGDGQTHYARRLVVGIGRKPNIPTIPGLKESDRIVHLTRYLPSVQRLPRDATIVVLGASQSAVEILLDLRARGFSRIVSIHRSFSYRLKDTSSFSDEVYFPEFTDYYHALPPDKRRLLDNQVRQTNYSSADGDIIDELYQRLYEDSLDSCERLTLLRNHVIDEVSDGATVSIAARDIYTGHAQKVHAALLILATGFLDVGRNGRDGLPPLLAHLSGQFSWSCDYLDVERDYRVRFGAAGEGHPDLYLNGLCESSHGLGDAGSFSLVSVRARDIVTSIQGRERARSHHDVRDTEATVRAS